ncbi:MULTISPECIES: hypothetical protein [unclassified Mesorhizobium]|uniref:hypothetical protein n=1 Tax=unclassified Mesorhizobium TaxID=325217 RepID=UPI000FCB080A|nr:MULTISPECIES: hypothetical protein [unclassified Mesorhizobium]RUW01096.1 hypothetical protein EOA53_31215 [Mesorhizobium sp. M1A.F.Ca.IN.020.03.1.1]RUW01108.1 hypothetical protein EOA49_12385 [Mesorhizobium sp. M1A.F.Ca.IN.020.04.1.1]RWF75498.1 MAG: hypothetical protein EOQ34_01675 [Mesorhizobium sp.]RWG16726.1 MAG: hypothetical protein EOQ58_07345 [Mesorhizobium sp.]RWG33443.1 MAG: hypothetical protein EOQ61_08365 [Mesorhizobium sp.]
MMDTDWAVLEFLREHIIGRTEPDRVSIGESLKKEHAEVYALALKAGATAVAAPSSSAAH